MKSDFATGRKPGADEWEMTVNKPGLLRGLQDFGVATKHGLIPRGRHPRIPLLPNFRLASLSTKTGFFCVLMHSESIGIR